MLTSGVHVPRPENRRTPEDVGLEYSRHVFPGAHDFQLEAWLVPQADARGTVVLFHGHAASKDALLREAKAFHHLGFRALLVDFHGSGGSSGNETSIGYHEATDVQKAFAYATSLPGSGPVVLYGQSMGAVATLKAVADGHLAPAGLILECPFDSLLGTTRHRFRAMGVPSFALADLLVFWGGVEEGFNALAFQPIDSAARVASPTLLLSGEEDPFVLPEETRALFTALKGPKTMEILPGVGHDSLLRRSPDAWTQIVGAFLEELGRPPRVGPPLEGAGSILSP